MSLYDGLGVETAPLPELIVSSAFAASEEEEEEQLPASPKKRPESPKVEEQKPDDSKPAQEEKTSFWNASNMKLMASQMMRQQMAASRVRGRGGARGRGRRPIPPAVAQGSTTVHQRSYINTDITHLMEDDLAGEIKDEYDPLLPNNYEEIKRLENEKEELLRLREKEKRREHYQMYADSYDIEDDEEEKERKKRKQDRKQKEMAAIPPPSFNMAPPPSPDQPKVDPEQENEGRIRLALEELSKIKAPRANPYGKKNFKTSEVASNIMSKYGWQEGQGLGKASQGISTALSVEKTSIKGGKIVNVAAEREQQLEEEKKKVKSLTNIIKNPTKVILLENMVGPGEVDNDLQPEVIEECAKYGEVRNCLVYEIPEGALDDEAVRIFVEFAKVDSAIKAVIDLNGRYFGGRTVRAGFYSEEKFSRYDLAPEPNNQIDQ